MTYLNKMKFWEFFLKGKVCALSINQTGPRTLFLKLFTERFKINTEKLDLSSSVDDAKVVCS